MWLSYYFLYYCSVLLQDKIIPSSLKNEEKCYAVNQLLGPLDEDQYQDPTSRLLLALWHGNEDVIQIVEEEVGLCRPLDSINKGAIYSGVGGVNPYSAGIDFSRQNLTSVDVRFWRLKSIPAL